MKFILSFLLCALAEYATSSPSPVDRSPSPVTFETTPLRPAPTQPAGADELVRWIQSVIPQVFPNHTTWPAAYDKYFDPSLVATFGLPAQNNYADRYNFRTFKALYQAIAAKIASQLSHAQIDVVDAVAYPFPNDTTAGYLYVTGLEYGTYRNGTAATAARDATFITVKNVNGERKIVEWREVSNFNF